LATLTTKAAHPGTRFVASYLGDSELENHYLSIGRRGAAGSSSMGAALREWAIHSVSEL
jgi:hypothetical protein